MSPCWSQTKPHVNRTIAPLYLAHCWGRSLLIYRMHFNFHMVSTSILELHEARRAETFLLALSITSGFTFTNKGSFRSRRNVERWEKYFNKAIDSVWNGWTICCDAFTMKQWTPDAASSKVDTLNTLAQKSRTFNLAKFFHYTVFISIGRDNIDY